MPLVVGDTTSRRMGYLVFGAAGGAFIVVAGVLTAVAWRIAGQPVKTTGDLLGELQALVAVAQLIVAGVLAATTIYNALQTWQMVVEMRKSAAEDERARQDQVRREQTQSIEGAANALIGATSDMVGAGTLLSSLLQFRRVWSVRPMVPLNTALVAMSRALDQLRYRSPGPVADAAGQVSDVAMEFYGAAGDRKRRLELETLARRIHQAKDAFREVVNERCGPDTAVDKTPGLT